ncbi:MAG: hypothetical protein WCJ87_13950, partial [Burkholderiales bacterium]
NRAHVHVRLGAFEFTFCHSQISEIKSVASDEVLGFQRGAESPAAGSRRGPEEDRLKLTFRAR